MAARYPGFQGVLHRRNPGLQGALIGSHPLVLVGCVSVRLLRAPTILCARLEAEPPALASPPTLRVPQLVVCQGLHLLCVLALLLAGIFLWPLARLRWVRCPCPLWRGDGRRSPGAIAPPAAQALVLVLHHGRGEHFP